MIGSTGINDTARKIMLCEIEEFFAAVASGGGSSGGSGCGTASKEAATVPLAFILAALRLGVLPGAACFQNKSVVTCNNGHGNGTVPSASASTSTSKILRKVAMLCLQGGCGAAVTRSIRAESWFPVVAGACSITSTASSRSCSSNSIFGASGVPPRVPGGELASNIATPTPASSSFASFRHSQCWQMQKDYYASAELSAWTDGGPVPFSCSSNLFVAQQYLTVVQLQVAAALLQRRSGHQYQFSRTFRVTVVELGAGHGIVSILLARLLCQKNLATRLGLSEDGTDIQCKIVCTDFSKNIFEHLLALPWILELCQQGLLDFAVADADAPIASASMRGIYSGSNSHDASDLLVVVAQYLFDSVATDLYVVVPPSPHHGTAAAAITTTTTADDVSGLFELGIEVVSVSSQKRKRKTSKERFVVTPLRSVSSSTSSSEEVYQKRLLAKLREIQSSNASIVAGGSVVACPTAGKDLLKYVQTSFPLTSNAPVAEECGNDTVGQVLMLVGDYIIEHDNEQWKGKDICSAISRAFHSDLSASTDAALPVATLDVTPVVDLPVISPQPRIMALPVSMAGLDLIFNHAFKQERKEGEGGEGESSVRTVSPLAGTCFSVAVLSTGRIAETIPSELSFAPTDFQCVRSYLSLPSTSSGAPASFTFAQSVSTGFLWEYLQCMGGWELSTFLDLRWLIFRKCAKEAEEDYQQQPPPQREHRHSLLEFVQAAAASLATQMHILLSYSEAQQCKSKLAQWYLAASAAMRSQSQRTHGSCAAEALSAIPLQHTLEVFNASSLLADPKAMRVTVTCLGREWELAFDDAEQSKLCHLALNKLGRKEGSGGEQCRQGEGRVKRRKYVYAFAGKRRRGLI